jgi:hypothetical protein
MVIDEPKPDGEQTPPGEQVVKVIQTEEDPWRALVQDQSTKMDSLTEAFQAFQAKTLLILETLSTPKPDQSKEPSEAQKPPASNPSSGADGLPVPKTEQPAVVKRLRRYL